jgi:hypothetical protein
MVIRSREDEADRRRQHVAGLDQRRELPAHGLDANGLLELVTPIHHVAAGHWHDRLPVHAPFLHKTFTEHA